MAERNKNMVFAATVVAGTAEGAGGQHLADSIEGLLCNCSRSEGLELVMVEGKGKCLLFR